MMHMHNGMHTRVAYCVTDLPLLRVRGLLILGPFLDHRRIVLYIFLPLTTVRGWGRGPARPEQVAAVRTVPYGRSSDVVAARKTRARREIARNRLR